MSIRINPRLPSPPTNIDPFVANYLNELVRALQFEFSQQSSNKDPYDTGAVPSTARDLSAVLTTSQLQEVVKTVIQDLKRQGILR